MIVFTILERICLKCIAVLFGHMLIGPISSQKQNGLIYMLQWTCQYKESLESSSFLEPGQESFISRNCLYHNCFNTANRSYFDSILDFDVLLFNIQHLRPSQYSPDYDPPLYRSERQLYVLTASESAALYPISNYYNGFFNLTWTYRFASDVFHPFFVVKDYFGEVVAPKIDVKWVNFDNMVPTNSVVIQKLRSKRVAAAWVASANHCEEHYKRYVFTTNLKQELSKYGHRIDIYGGCGNMPCPRTPNGGLHLLPKCYEKIQSEYYFYLAFENSFARDYVSEKVLYGLQHFAVPIVFGGADYSRFLPDGSYIDATTLGVTRLAKEMIDIINDPPRYYDFFKWHGYYRFQDTTDNDHRESICDFCAYLNKARRLNRSVETYHDIYDWWNTLTPMNSWEESTTETSMSNKSPPEIILTYITNFLTNVVDFISGDS